ncbi:MAG TPA: DUF5719 family protein [Streptosporangiaceae bacterium]|nr:DUF5719 family protein [Streptosporangiaceae bacterium]
MNRPALRRLVPVVAVIAVLAGLYGLAGTGHPIALASGSAPPRAGSATVTTVTRACPAPGAGFNGGGGLSALSSPGAGAGSAKHGQAATGQAATGQAQVTRLAGAGSADAGHQLFSITQPGTARFEAVPTDHSRTPARAAKSAAHSVATTPLNGGVVVQASGAMAQGLDVEQTAQGGLPTADCASPRTDFWFVGPGRHSAGHIQLYLMNTGGQPAGADVDISTDAGPLQGITDTGITVPPHGMVVQDLATALANSRSMALHVRTSVGQVVAAVQESNGAGQGSWLPASQPPARHVIIPGLPATTGTRALYVGVPGVKDANVKITAVTSRGSYEPTGAGGIDIPGGSAVAITLPSLSGIPGAIRLTTTQPVTATAMASGGTQGAPGVFTAATPAIQQQGVVAGNLSGGGHVSSLVLTAPRGKDTVRVTEVPAGRAGGGQGRPHTKVVTVKPAHSVAVQLTAPAGSARGAPFGAVVTPLPGSGPLYVGRVISGIGTGAALLQILPVPSALTQVPLPTVRDSPITSAP